MQRLADIDIAEPRDEPLIEQQRLDRRLPPAKGLGEKRRVERLVQRFDAEPLEELVASSALVATSSMKPKRRGSL